MTEPVRYSPAIEDVQPDEQEVVARLNDTFDIILERTSADYGRAVRAVHAKAHAIMEGVLTVDAGLPRELAQGLFAQPGAHRAFVRISTNPGDILDDAISLPRGLALKVLDVAGERLPGAEGTTQDFVMVDNPVFMARDAGGFLGNLKLLARTTDRGESAKIALSALLRALGGALGAIGIDAPALKSIGGAPNSEPLGETYFSATPFRFGDHVAKFSLTPVAPAMTALTGATIATGGDPDAIRTAMRPEVRAADLEWEFRVQLAHDLRKQPIEDPTIEWKEQDTPFRRVGVLRVAAQDSWEPVRVHRVDETMRFSVWTGIAAHRPLGNINRARRDVYRHSADFRARTNGCPIHEPA